MSIDNAAAYGEAFADVYDQWYENITDAEATANFLTQRCSKELPVLELGVGTGRLVGPMVNAGLQVVGVDASEAMLAQCAKAHPSVELIQADLATFEPPTQIGGALCAFNTLFNLTDPKEQQRLITSVANALAPDAPLVIEAITGFELENAPERSVGLSEVDPTKTVISAVVTNSSKQSLTGQHAEWAQDRTFIKRNWHLRWSTPNQLDEMAEIAGLRLAERFADWNMTAFTPTSSKHISVYLPS